MIPLMKNTFLNEYETKKALAEFILQEKKLSMGEKCSAFERKFAGYQGRSDAVLFNSGGSANLALLQTLKNLDRLKTGQKVGISALTWSTNVMPVIQMGFEPVPIDCDPATLNVMSAQVKEKLASIDLKALFLTNALGFAGDLDNIRDLCRSGGIFLLEDNCEALGTELPSGKAGNFGVASTFSFYVAHHMSTVEGGMVATDDEDIAEMLRLVRANGWDRNLSAVQQRKWRKKYNIGSEFEAKYTFYDLAFNFRPTEIIGFLGLYQMQFLEENIKAREINYLHLEKTIRRNPDMIPLQRDHLSVLSPFAMPILCKTPELKDHYLDQFAGAGVEIRPMIAGNIQRQPFYSRYVHSRYDLPGTDFIHDCGFYCGNYPDLTGSELETIGSCLLKY